MCFCSLLLAAMHLHVDCARETRPRLQRRRQKLLSIPMAICNLETGPRLQQQVQKLLPIAMVMAVRPSFRTRSLALKPTPGWTCLCHTPRNRLRRPAPAQVLQLQVSLHQVHPALQAAPAAPQLLTSLALSLQPAEAVRRASSTPSSIQMPARVLASLAPLGQLSQTTG